MNQFYLIFKSDKPFGREMNLLKKPNKNEMQGLRFATAIIEYKNAERKLREYEIAQPYVLGLSMKLQSSTIYCNSRYFIDGDIFTADIDNNKLVNLTI